MHLSLSQQLYLYYIFKRLCNFKCNLLGVYYRYLSPSTYLCNYNYIYMYIIYIQYTHTYIYIYIYIYIYVFSFKSINNFKHQFLFWATEICSVHMEFANGLISSALNILPSIIPPFLESEILLKEGTVCLFKYYSLSVSYHRSQRLLHHYCSSVFSTTLYTSMVLVWY